MRHALDEVTPLAWRPLAADDLPAVSELLTTIELHDDAAERHTVEELHVNLAALGGASVAAVGLDRGTAVALGWNLAITDGDGERQVFISGGVHPSWRQLGIGRRLLAWQLEQARHHVAQHPRDGSGCTVVAHCDERTTSRAHLYRRLGLVPVRRHIDLYRALSDAVPEAPLPAGVEVVPWQPERSEEVRRVHNDAFVGMARARPVSAEDWAASHSRPAARPQWSWLAVETGTDEVVGHVSNSADVEQWAAQGYSQGWTDQVAVRRDRQGRGIARALLVRSMLSFVEAGLQAAGLGVDTDQVSGPVQPYHSLGYTVTDSVVRHELPPDPCTGER